MEGASNDAPPVESSGTSFSLRLAGVDKGDFVSARMRVKEVQVTGGGQVLANAVKTPEVDLAELDQAWLLTSFDAPAGVEDVEFVVSFETAAVATEPQLRRRRPLPDAPHAGKVSRVAERRHAVITRRGPIVRAFLDGDDAGAALPAGLLTERDPPGERQVPTPVHRRVCRRM